MKHNHLYSKFLFIAFIFISIFLFSSFQEKDISLINENLTIQVDTLPKAPSTSSEEIYKVVEEMPRFPGCEDKGSKEEIYKCSQQELLKYIYGNLKYPDLARKNKVEGMVIIQFNVDVDGSVIEAKIIRDIGDGCGEEALKVVENMNNLPQKWIPGKQRGKTVKVQYTLPVKFKLQ